MSENRQQILKDRSLMDKIEKQLELKRKPIQKEVQ
ncbi:FbpB family small basic protein [Virgibacillus sp. Bac332]